jgi:hypothetical protein
MMSCSGRASSAWALPGRMAVDRPAGRNRCTLGCRIAVVTAWGRGRALATFWERGDLLGDWRYAAFVDGNGAGNGWFCGGLAQRVAWPGYRRTLSC